MPCARLSGKASELSSSMVDESQNRCNECNKSFSHKSNLNRHLKQIHHLNVSKPRDCPVCETKFTCKLEEHLSAAHQIDLESIDKEFESMNDFHEWKVEQELKESVKYKQNKSKDKTIIFVCNRSGRSSGGNSLKIGKNCPSRMIVKIKENKVTVDYQSTHVGHEPLESLRGILISSDCRQLIINLLEKGASTDFIKKTIQSKFDFRSRDFYVDENDIRRIKFRSSLNGHHHSNDSISCTAMIQQLASDDSSNQSSTLR